MAAQRRQTNECTDEAFIEVNVERIGFCQIDKAGGVYPRQRMHQETLRVLETDISVLLACELYVESGSK